MQWWCAALCACALAGAGAFRADDLPTDKAMAMDPEDEDELLGGVGGGAALCAGAARCAGALWGRRWLLARASCAAALPLRRAAVLPRPGLAACDNASIEAGAIGVLARFVHPEHGSGARAHDAALLLLARDAPAPPPCNRSHAMLLVPELERWLESIPSALPLAGGAPVTTRRHGVAALRLTSSPLRLLAAAVLLPAAALLLLFALALRLPGDALRYDLLPEGPDHAPTHDGDHPKPSTLEDPTPADRLLFF